MVEETKTFFTYRQTKDRPPTARDCEGAATPDVPAEETVSKELAWPSHNQVVES